MTPLAALADVPDGTTVLVRGVVRRVHVFPRRLLDVVIEDEGQATTVRARWFRAPGGMARAFPKGGPVAVAGPLHTARDGTRELLQPSVVTAALVAGGGAGLGIRPRYAQVAGVPGRTLERVRAAALAAVATGGAVDLAPLQALRRLGLPPIAEALRTLHAPSEDLGRRRRRAGACCSSARSWRSWLFSRSGRRTRARPGRRRALSSPKRARGPSPLCRSS